MQYIAFDSHKHYTLASVEEEALGGRPMEARIPHERGLLRSFLGRCQPGSPVAVETVGNWYWIVDEIEEAGFEPRLVHARKAKLMMGMINKTDKLDARGLNRLQRNQTLPTVWIPPKELRDQRDVPRTRMVLARERTILKNRIHATLAKYALTITGTSDIFGKRIRPVLIEQIAKLPPHTRRSTEHCLDLINELDKRIGEIEEVIKRDFVKTPDIANLMTIPGIGPILATVIALEIGDIERFPSPGHLACYSGTTPKIQASGGRQRTGRLRHDVNRYIQWALIEAANTVAAHRRHYPQRHLSRVYEAVRSRKSHGTAVGAVARRIAEACYWVLKKHQSYREPRRFPAKKVSSRNG